MTTRSFCTTLILVASLLMATLALATAHPLTVAPASPEPAAFDHKRRGVPALMPSPITKRPLPRPTQSPKPGR